MNALPTHCDYSADDFDATAITAGGVRIIQVTGSARCRGNGWQLDFAPGGPGTAQDAGHLCLSIRETPPRRVGRYWSQANIEAMIEDSQATEVVIHFGWRPSIVIRVRETSSLIGGGARSWREPASVPAPARPAAERPFATALRMV